MGYLDSIPLVIIKAVPQTQAAPQAQALPVPEPHKEERKLEEIVELKDTDTIASNMLFSTEQQQLLRPQSSCTDVSDSLSEASTATPTPTPTVSNIPDIDESNFDVATLTCKLCNKTMKNLRNFKVHRARHLGTLNHKCPDCEKSFEGRSAVNRHMLVNHNRELLPHEITINPSANTNNVKPSSGIKIFKPSEMAKKGSVPIVTISESQVLPTSTPAVVSTTLPFLSQPMPLQSMPSLMPHSATHSLPQLGLDIKQPIPVTMSNQNILEPPQLPIIPEIKHPFSQPQMPSLGAVDNTKPLISQLIPQAPHQIASESKLQSLEKHDITKEESLSTAEQSGLSTQENPIQAQMSHTTLEVKKEEPKIFTEPLQSSTPTINLDEKKVTPSSDLNDKSLQPTNDDIFDAVRERKVVPSAVPLLSKLELPSASSPEPMEDAAPEPTSVHSAGQMPILLSNPGPEPIRYIVGAGTKSDGSGATGDEENKPDEERNNVDDDDDHHLPDLEIPLPSEDDTEQNETEETNSSNVKPENVPQKETDAAEKDPKTTDNIVDTASKDEDKSKTVESKEVNDAPPVLTPAEEEQPKVLPPEIANIEKIIPESDSDTDSKSSSSSSSSDDSDSEDSSSSSSSSSDEDEDGEEADVEQDDIQVIFHIFNK